MKVSAIVPIFNEEKGISRVVKTLLGAGDIDEIICVNDGSTDKSLQILKSFQEKIKIVNLTRNRGKGFALASGIKQAKNEIVLFIDADLINLSDQHVKMLVTPLIEGKARAVIGYSAKKGLRKYFTGVFSYLSGERAYYKEDLLPHLDEMAQTRFGVEVFLNGLFKNKEIKRVPLVGLVQPPKQEKRELSVAIKEYIAEATEIAQQLAKKEVVSVKDTQILKELKDVTGFVELKEKIGMVKNKKIRSILQKYILKYLKL
jgi:glycosyltransferase involved in cell wall biosynthesis